MRVVILGAGQAGYAAAAALRDRDFRGQIFLIGGEVELPYQRPPLSKEFLSGKLLTDMLYFRQPAEFDAAAIEFIAGDPAIAIDRPVQQVMLASGRTIAYDHLIIATGTRNRVLFDPAITGIFALRSLGDATAIKSAFDRAYEVAILGGGFLGLEIAVAARTRGLAVHVIEAEVLPLSRNVSSAISHHILAHHRAAGIDVRLGTRLRALQTAAGHVRAVELDDGSMVSCDMLVTSVGVVPNDEIAAAAGLAIANGIRVNDRLETSDPHISAIGDCARFPYWANGDAVRLESVQNAVDQAECVAERLCGNAAAYVAVPWFWSDQGGIRLQIAGLRAGADRIVRRSGATEAAFSTFCFKAGRLICVESINMPGHHMKARRFLAPGAKAPAPDEVEAGVL
jgi:3-phenylpropionate/trans-cinnamate dioxygenase ferredoxin reductase subunit